MTAIPVQQIYDTASTSPAIREHVALELAASWPIPIRRGQGQAFVFFYYGLSGPPAKPSFDIHAPSKRVEIDEQGQPGPVTDLTPAMLNLPGNSGQVLGPHVWPASWNQVDMDHRVSALMTAYDAVIPLWLARGSSNDPRALDFRQRFRELCPDSLVAYYRALGPDFFGWVGLR